MVDPGGPRAARAINPAAGAGAALFQMLFTALPLDVLFCVLAEVGFAGLTALACTCTAGRAAVRRFHQTHPGHTLASIRGSAEVMMYVVVRIDAATWQTRRKVTEALKMHDYEMGVTFSHRYPMQIEPDDRTPKLHTVGGYYGGFYKRWRALWTMRPDELRISIGRVCFMKKLGRASRDWGVVKLFDHPLTASEFDDALSACRVVKSFFPDSTLRAHATVEYVYHHYTACPFDAVEQARLNASGLFVSCGLFRLLTTV